MNVGQQLGHRQTEGPPTVYGLQYSQCFHVAMRLITLVGSSSHTQSEFHVYEHNSEFIKIRGGIRRSNQVWCEHSIGLRLVV